MKKNLKGFNHLIKNKTLSNFLIQNVNLHIHSNNVLKGKKNSVILKL